MNLVTYFVFELKNIGDLTFPTQNNFLNVVYFFMLFLYLWLCCAFVAVCGCSLVAESRDYCLIVVHGFSLWLPSLVAAHRL